MTKKILVSGAGCCLVDRLYCNIPFTTETFSSYLSKERGDGGLSPGHLVFKEEFEQFAKKDFFPVLKKITQGKSPDKVNIGGPCIVAMIHAAQMSEKTGSEFRFYGYGGKDEDGAFLLSALKQTPVNIENYKLEGENTPSTVVLSDPTYDNGHGERIFINTIGAAWDFTAEKIDPGFFDSDVVVLGGTAIVPNIHDSLTELLLKAKSKGCVTIVNTVFDFRNEKISSTAKWPLGKSDESYQNIDLLITDFEEALRLSGKRSLDEAVQFFREKGTGAVVVTNGSKNIRAWSSGKFFRPLIETDMPISEAVSKELAKGHMGDTTGCGDNFVGGVIASLVSQLQQTGSIPDLTEACMWGVVSGGYTCFYMGGTYFEKQPGEKSELIAPYYEQYKKQISVSK
jgi:sugar/nucleoside kinase (ribokinase family)